MADQTSDYVLCAVGPSSYAHDTLQDELARAAMRAGIRHIGDSKTLGAKHHLNAVEIPVVLATDAVSDIRNQLYKALGDRADIALLPAQNRRKKLLVSDMDSTIIEQECLDELADFAGLKAEISAVTERAMRGELDFESALTERVGKLVGLPLTALQQCYETSLTLMPGAKTLTATLRAHSAFCLLVSGGFTFFTARVAAASGFQDHRGNLLLDDGTALTGEVGRPILGRAAKLDFLDDAAFANGVTRRDTLAMGDGANDLAMIEAAGLGIAIHAKPVVAEAADAAINVTDLTSVLYFQGYSDAEISWAD